tara:strand:+ start:343 stop:555 length:213 start_codon:yes stop_codon:yes gene_type:complete
MLTLGHLLKRYCWFSAADDSTLITDTIAKMPMLEDTKTHFSIHCDACLVDFVESDWVFAINDLRPIFSIH